MNLTWFGAEGRKTLCFSFLLLFLLPVCSEGKEKRDGYFKVYREKDRVIWELSESLVGREWLLVNQLAAVGGRYEVRTGDMSGDPKILQLRRSAEGEMALILKANMSKNAGSNLVGPPKKPRVIASFPMMKVGKEKSIRLDITSWVACDTGMVNGKLLLLTLKTITHPDCLEMIAWRERKGGRVQASSCLFLMPEELMRLRYEDERVGYYRSKHLVCEDTMVREDEFYCISRWRLEPRPEDVKKYRQGILVEPLHPILFYIDPLTPARWVPYIETAINNWQSALERAGFKNAIQARVAPENDSTWTLESCRAALVYRPSTEENAFGERYADPRSGQIYHARIMWGHSLVEWLKKNYILQVSPSDPAVLTEGVSDEWLGTLLAVIVSHEVGHTLGLTHNMGASSCVPVEKLRDNDWLTTYGLSPSIMDYSRFNYVAQPGDHIDRLNLIPRIGVYDRWAIEWGYRLFPEMKTLEEEHTHVLAWTGEEQKKWGCWFGSEMNTGDPRAQAEDLGDDLVAANTYGMKNLKWVLTQINQWAPDQNGRYAAYQDVYNRIVSIGERNVPMGQYYFYVKQVLNVVGGNYLNYDEQARPVRTPVDREYRHRAMMFLGEHVFTTPAWLLEPMCSGRVENDPMRVMSSLQTATLVLLFSKVSSLATCDSVGVYTMNDFFEDMNRVVWQDVLSGELPDIYRQNLHQVFLRQVSSHATNGGSRTVQLYKEYIAGLKEKLKQVRVKHKEENFGIYCRDLIRVMDKFLK